METVSQNACASGGKKRGGKRRRNKEKRPIEEPHQCLKVTKKRRGGKHRCNKEKRPIEEPHQYLKVTKEVLKSDEKLWALYEQWCCQCMPYRTAEEKQMRFPFFKKCAFWVRKMNQKSGGGVALTVWADETDKEREQRHCCGWRPSCHHTAEERRRRLVGYP